MKFPIKLNYKYVPNFLRKIIPNHFSPIYLFSGQELSTANYHKAISCFKFGKTYKTTESGRHKLTNDLLLSRISKDEIILDVGASTGVTSYELIKALNFTFSKYFITDLNLKLFYNKLGNKYFFFNESNQCILIADEYFIVYYNELSWCKFLFRDTVSYQSKKEMNHFNLVCKDVDDLIRNDSRVVLYQYDVFKQWDHINPTIIKVANLFNLVYFSEIEVIKAFGNLFSVLKELGIIAVIDNRDIEKSSIFIKEGNGVVLLESINGGSEVQSIIMQHFK